MLQDVIVYIIGLLIAGWLCRRLYRFVSAGKKPHHPCGDCRGCGMRDYISASKGISGCADNKRKDLR
ncbi:MAG: hypothetical protein LBR08_01735 [Bacteroidales bacterium]|jgi:hypothetical protein|nr:hypothetical protein [Bacteroidales bacterium]